MECLFTSKLGLPFEILSTGANRDYRLSPLNFVGQKHNFLAPVVELLEEYITHHNLTPDGGGLVVLELFGGSGLLSNTIKTHFPEAEVVWNDYDDFRSRLTQIPETNQALQFMRACLGDTPWQARLAPSQVEEIQAYLNTHSLRGKLDVISLAANLSFSSNRHSSRSQFLQDKAYYNRVRKNDYHAEGYLNGVVRISEDAFVILDRLLSETTHGKHLILLVDPPYVATCTTAYQGWKLEQFNQLALKLAELDVRCCFWSNGKSGMHTAIKAYQQLMEELFTGDNFTPEDREIFRQAAGTFTDIRITSRDLDDAGKMLDGKDYMLDNFYRYYYR